MQQKSKIRIIIGLMLLYIAVFFNWQWVWGILFLVWIIPDLFSGITYFMEPIEKKKNPLLYWAVVVSWMWMSIYMMIGSFFMPFDMQAYEATSSTKNVGVYEDASSKQVSNHLEMASATNSKNDIVAKQELKQNKKDQKQEKPLAVQTPLKEKQPLERQNVVKREQKQVETSVEKEVPQKKESKPKEDLVYKTYQQKETNYFVGISADMNANDPNLEKNTKELWDYFYENDFSTTISNIVDERIYFIYSNTDQAGNYKATIAFRTKDTKNIYEGLEGVQVPPTTFAVFESNGANVERFISDTWTKVYTSNLNFSDGFNLEVYELDQSYKVKKAEIRVAIK